MSGARHVVQQAPAGWCPSACPYAILLMRMCFSWSTHLKNIARLGAADVDGPSQHVLHRKGGPAVKAVSVWAIPADSRQACLLVSTLLTR